MHVEDTNMRIKKNMPVLIAKLKCHICIFKCSFYFAIYLLSLIYRSYTKILPNIYLRRGT